MAVPPSILEKAHQGVVPARRNSPRTRLRGSEEDHPEVRIPSDLPPRRPAFLERRRGARVNARVPVVLEWQSEDGQGVRIEAVTRLVSPYGCLVVLQQKPALDQKLRLTNLATSNTNLAVVVWTGKERAEGQEFGIELMDPEMDFWGLEL